jgi:UDP-N-acetylmuramoyl-L-alanyl-D-glutamate--2,6-diaminopimelate ligase
MESYFQAKRLLFDRHLADDGRRVLPVEDPWGARLLDEHRPGDLSWGLGHGDVSASEVTSDLTGTTFLLALEGVSLSVQIRLLGVHNLRNALAAAACAHALGANSDAVRAGLEAARPLAGRLEPMPLDLPFPVLVDYAHTPGGLRTVLQSLRRLSDRRLIVVFGAGGDRDPGKRGQMGFAAGELADLAVVTSDNPRSEDPAAIAAAVADGVRAAGAVPRLVLDRREAIAQALEAADDGSLILIAGKGHETTQTVGDRVLAFSDHDVVRELAGRAVCG